MSQGVLISGCAVIHDVVIFQTDGLHARRGQHLHIFRRRGERVGVFCRAFGVGQRAFKVDECHVVSLEDAFDVGKRKIQTQLFLCELFIEDALAALACVAADGYIACRGNRDNNGAVILHAPVAAVFALIPRALFPLFSFFNVAELGKIERFGKDRTGKKKEESRQSGGDVFQHGLAPCKTKSLLVIQQRMETGFVGFPAHVEHGGRTDASVGIRAVLRNPEFHKIRAGGHQGIALRKHAEDIHRRKAHFHAGRNFVIQPDQLQQRQAAALVKQLGDDLPLPLGSGEVAAGTVARVRI